MTSDDNETATEPESADSDGVLDETSPDVMVEPDGKIVSIKDYVEGAKQRPDDPSVPAGPDGGDFGEFDPEPLNAFFAYIVVGGRPTILHEAFKREDRADARPIEDHIQFWSVNAFGGYFADELIATGDPKKPTWKSKADLWMRDHRRRKYQGIVFEPTPHGEKDRTPEGYYNFWRGYAHDPDPKGDCSTLMRHIEEVLARGDDEASAYIWAWGADMIQNPDKRKGVSLVLRGKMGTGKTFFGEACGALIPQHYVLVDDPRYITGNFNAHMASTILLQADEGFWAGDKQAEGRLKGLVTSTRHMVESKGRDAVTMRNHIRLLVTTNETWAVPAGHEERRFAVFDVGDEHIQDHAWFAKIKDELNHKGGYGRLMHEFMEFDLSSVDLWNIPRTEALLEQKLATMPVIEQWWLDCLQRGYIRASEDGYRAWPTTERGIAVDDVMASYRAFCDTITGALRKLPPNQLGTALRRVVPDLEIFRPWTSTRSARPRFFRVPPLDTCRRHFAAELRAEIDWGRDENGPADAAEQDDYHDF